eukprot:scaffold11693_cov115-Isochrysis_galbana.AAC.2
MLWLLVDRQSASSALYRLRASTRVSRGREIIPVVSPRQCCRRGHAQHLCPWPKPSQWAPAEAGAASGAIVTPPRARGVVFFRTRIITKRKTVRNITCRCGAFYTAHNK